MAATFLLRSFLITLDNLLTRDWSQEVADRRQSDLEMRKPKLLVIKWLKWLLILLICAQLVCSVLIFAQWNTFVHITQKYLASKNHLNTYERNFESNANFFQIYIYCGISGHDVILLIGLLGVLKPYYKLVLLVAIITSVEVVVSLLAFFVSSIFFVPFTIFFIFNVANYVYANLIKIKLKTYNSVQSLQLMERPSKSVIQVMKMFQDDQSFADLYVTRSTDSLTSTNATQRQKGGYLKSTYVKF